MKVIHQNKRTKLVPTNQAHQSGLPVAVIKSARKKLQLLEAAPDERTLRNWKSLHYKQLTGGRKGFSSIRLNGQWRMLLKVDSSTQPPTITIFDIEDYH